MTVQQLEEMTGTGSMGTMTASVVPVLYGPGAANMQRRRKKFRDLKKQPTATKESLLDNLLGEDSSLFPDDAIELGTTQSKPGDKKEGPEFPVYSGGKLLDPSICLVAPDATPRGNLPIDPSAVPQPPAPAAITPPVALPASPVQPPPQVQPSIPSQNASANVVQTLLGHPTESYATPHELQLTENMPSGYNVLAAAMTPGLPMPDHKHDPDASRKLMENVRRFIV